MLHASSASLWSLSLQDFRVNKDSYTSHRQCKTHIEFNAPWPQGIAVECWNLLWAKTHTQASTSRDVYCWTCTAICILLDYIYVMPEISYSKALPSAFRPAARWGVRVIPTPIPSTYGWGARIQYGSWVIWCLYRGSTVSTGEHRLDDHNQWECLRLWQLRKFIVIVHRTSRVDERFSHESL